MSVLFLVFLSFAFAENLNLCLYGRGCALTLGIIFPFFDPTNYFIFRKLKAPGIYKLINFSPARSRLGFEVALNKSLL